MDPVVRETYDGLAPIYDRRWSRYVEATVRATMDGLDVRPGKRVLDLAAGTGAVARRLREAEVVAVDLSRAMLSRARGGPGAAPALVQADAARLPFRDGAFDRVVCTSSFHLFPGPAAVLGEVRRVLRPGGEFVLTDWCDDYLSCRLCGLYLRLTDPSYRGTYRSRDCARMLREAGLPPREVRRFKIDWLWGLMRFSSLRPGGR